MAMIYSLPDHWDLKDLGLDEKDMQFFHRELWAILMHVGIGVVTKKSIPHIVERLKLVGEGWHKEIETRVGTPLADYLKKFIGYKANVYIEGKGEWLKRHSRDVPSLGKKTAEMLRKESERVRAGPVSERYS